jgi:uncharacterized membrane protein
LITGRWIAVLATFAVVVALVGLDGSVLARDLHWWVAIVEGAAAAVGVCIGIGARRIARRTATRRSRRSITPR